VWKSVCTFQNLEKEIGFFTISEKIHSFFPADADGYDICSAKPSSTVDEYNDP